MTTTRTDTIRDALNRGDLNQLATALAKFKAGNAFSKIKVTFSGLTSAAAQDITTAAAKAAATYSGIATLATGENLPPIGHVVALRVTAGAATAGARVVVDASGTAGAPGANGPGVAKLSDDGATLTFEAAVTGFVLVYYPAPYVGLDTSFPQGAP